MKAIIVQLSDVHLSVEKWPDNPATGRDDLLVAAIGSLFIENATACVLLINGDLAYAGLDSEYELAEHYFGKVRDGLVKLYGRDKVVSVVVPGNHDCNFRLDNDARRQLITDLDVKGFGDGSVADVCTKIQDSFFGCCQRFQKHPNPISGIDRIVAEHCFTFGSEELAFRVLNSAWCSRNPEKAGSLILPASVLAPRLSAASSAQLVVTAIHHPYSWLEPNNAREVRRLIEESSDLVLRNYLRTPFLADNHP